MKKSLITLAVAGLVGLGATAALADDAYQGSWYVLPGVSFAHTDSDIDSDDGVGGFIRLGKELSEHWDVQIGLSHIRAGEDLSVPASGHYKQTLLGVDALYMFSRERFRPFVLAGLGLARNDIDYSVGGANVGGEKTSWMANVGAGAQFMFTEALGMQADVRHVWSRADVQGNPLTSSDTETVGNTYLNIGGIFKFGAPKQVAAVEPEPAPAPVAAAEPAPEPAPAPVAEPTPAPPAFEKITLDSEVLFGFDKDTLRPEGKQKLDTDVVEILKAHPEVELILISGHTDRIGNASYNQALSERRAISVKKHLVSQGIEEKRLHAVGKGETEPVVDCKGIRGKEAIKCLQPNRRVVVEIEEQR
jgi:OOP family OmpA-OmpF porin